MKQIKYILVFVVLMFLSSCVEIDVSEVKSLEIGGIVIKSAYGLGDDVDLNDAYIHIFFEGNESDTPDEILSIESNKITLSGSGVDEGLKLKTSELGTYAIRISYGGVSLTINYDVVLDGDSQSVLDMIDIEMEIDTIQDIEDVAQVYNALTSDDIKTYILGNSNIRDFLEFYDGSGTENDPYQIANWYHLNNVRNDLSSGTHYELISDLDDLTFAYELLASASANEGFGWTPIGLVVGTPSTSSEFQGSFDGNNNTISDLKINRAELEDPENKDTHPGLENNVGLFSAIGSADEAAPTVIKDLNLDVSVAGFDEVGGLAGKAMGHTEIDNVSVAGTVKSVFTWSGSLKVYGQYTGGLVGSAEGLTITNSHFSGTVIGRLSVGGLVGEAVDTTVTESSATGDITLTLIQSALPSNKIGGLIGSASNVEITQSFVNSILNLRHKVKLPTYWDYNGTESAGGLIGYSENDLVIENSYFIGEVNGKNYVGGLVGQVNQNTGDYVVSITNTYAVVTVDSENEMGMIVGMINDPNEGSYAANYDFSNNFYRGAAGDRGINFYYTTGTRPVVTHKPDDSIYCQYLDDTGMKNVTSYDDWVDFNNIWSVDGSVNDGYPYLTNNPPQ